MRALIVLVLLTGPTWAQDDLKFGESAFMENCAGCHGEDASGYGPMTEILTVDVPDLTRLSDRNGGDFPWLRVVHMVDGRSGLPAHGGPMPIFGNLLKGDTAAADAPDGTPILTSARVLEIVKYLETIQVED